MIRVAIADDQALVRSAFALLLRMPGDKGWLTGTYMYDQTFNRGNVDYGSAIAILIVVLGVVLSNVANRVFNPRDDI